VVLATNIGLLHFILGKIVQTHLFMGKTPSFLSERHRQADYMDSPWVSGIAPGPDGAYSIALSGGYDDDVDEGYAL